MTIDLIGTLRASALADVFRRNKIRRRLRREARGIFSRLQLLRGIIHVGANAGQERQSYWARDLDVIWIEPIPEVFRRLEQNIAKYKKQRAINALISDSDFTTVEFNIASNDGGSSSILPLGVHAELFPDIKYIQSIKLETVTLETLMVQYHVDPGMPDGLVLDVQGAELHVLRGALRGLRKFRFIQCEAADTEIYTGACTIDDLNRFLGKHGFREVERLVTGESSAGRMFDVVYERA